MFPKELHDLPPGGTPDLIEDLLKVNMGPLLKYCRDRDPDGKRYGLLPYLWECYIAGNTSSSYCERVISIANQVMTDGRTLLDDDILEMLACLRMNRAFMESMKKKHPELIMEIVKAHEQKLIEVIAAESEDANDAAAGQPSQP